MLVTSTRRTYSWSSDRCIIWNETLWLPYCASLKSCLSAHTKFHDSLRHIEYYRGILFLTTNRISTFDEAFLSRIHVALHYTELSTTTKIQIWYSFLKKAGVAEGRISDELVKKLAERNMNGRQIKNACRTATSSTLR